MPVLYGYDFAAVFWLEHWARASASVDLTRRVGQLETERVSKPEFDIAVQDIERRLGRIEDKLDRQK